MGRNVPDSQGASLTADDNAPELEQGQDVMPLKKKFNTIWYIIADADSRGTPLDPEVQRLLVGYAAGLIATDELLRRGSMYVRGEHAVEADDERAALNQAFREFREQCDTGTGYAAEHIKVLEGLVPRRRRLR